MDEKLILTLVDKFSAGNIGELEFCEGSTRLLLRKENAASAVLSAAPVPPAVRPAEASAGERGHSAQQGSGTQPAEYAGRVPGPDAPGNGKTAAAGNEFITSPIVGTFYPSPGPDAPSFVRPGSQVKAGDTLCILEAMKMMNQLVAEFDCEIVAVKAAGGDMVEYGQELFEVKRPG
jgi:acetyl-CoA carboxylase biotin carboxyl carrier protein